MAHIKILYVETDGVVEGMALPDIAKRLGVRRDSLSRSKRMAETDGKNEFKCCGRTIYINPPKYAVGRDHDRLAVLEKKRSGPLLPNLCKHRLGYSPSRHG